MLARQFFFGFFTYIIDFSLQVLQLEQSRIISLRTVRNRLREHRVADWHCVGNICTLECKIGHKFYLLMNHVSIYTAATADQGVTAELRTLHRRLRCTMPVFNGLGSILVWGGITAHGRTPLVINDRNLTGIWCRDNIFQHVLPFIQNHGQQTTLQQDNARPQVACVVLDFLRQQNVNVMPWSAVSP